MIEERNIEMTVIGTVINTPSTYNDVAKYILDNSVWHDGRCRRLWNLISGMIKRREHVPPKCFLKMTKNCENVDDFLLSGSF